MKITAQEEYGLRILLRIANCQDTEGFSIPQLSQAEGLTTPYVAKLTRALRLHKFIRSTPGNKGGYVLAGAPETIKIKDVLESLGGVLFDKNFCGTHTGSFKFCTNSVECSARSLWQRIQLTLDDLLEHITLADLLAPVAV